MSKIFKLLFLLIISNSALGQKFTVRGMVTNQKTGEYLVGCSVFNVSKQIGTVTNEQGLFKISGERGDLIQFTYIGMAVNQMFMTSDEEVKIEMKYQRKRIKSVKIVAEQIARKSVLFNPDYDNNKNKRILEPVRRTAKEMVKQGAPKITVDGLVMSPITMLYYAFNKKARRRLDAIVDINKLDASNQKYSLDFISIVTKVQDRDELKDIKAYCYFPHDRVLTASFYELGLMTKDCYIEYLEDKRDKLDVELEKATDNLPKDE